MIDWDRLDSTFEIKDEKCTFYYRKNRKLNWFDSLIHILSASRFIWIRTQSGQQHVIQRSLQKAPLMFLYFLWRISNFRLALFTSSLVDSINLKISLNAILNGIKQNHPNRHVPNQYSSYDSSILSATAPAVQQGQKQDFRQSWKGLLHRIKNMADIFDH